MNYIGIDLGGTKILGALFNEKGQILARAKKKTKANEGVEVIFAQISKVLDLLIKESDGTEIGAIGIGVPGIIDGKNGVVAFSPNIPWVEYPLAEEIRKKYGIRTFIGNDVNVGILGEWKFGAGKEKKNLLGIFVGTGIGGGIIINGELYEGAIGAAGEIGHICIDPNGPYCGCGSRGCVEALASKTAILKEIEAQIKRGKKSILGDLIKESGGILKSSHLMEGYEVKDELTLDVIEKMSEYLGIAVASYLNILNPEVVVFGGGIMESMSEIFIPKIRQHASRYCMPKILESCELKIAEVGENAGILGALALAMKGVE